ncbi:MFS transporter [Gilvimarinus sp. F26214L]|uniref:MFS transporter n=1 Tax=Gilvimarinus sp. DZF01 TaxID=3461371 RepID=UPI004045C7E0
MPKSVYVLALGIFVMVTSELIVGGLMPQMSLDLGATIPQIGYLITAFALGMALGGPFAATAVGRLRPKYALLVLFVVFFIGNALAVVAGSYGLILFARILTGTVSGAFFGVALSVVAQLAAPSLRGRATGIALQGLMVGTLLGLPLSTLIGDHWGWRASFGVVGFLTIVVAAVTMATLPNLGHPKESADLGQELTVFRKPRLWLAMATSTLIIGATFAAFSYFAPILIEVTHYSPRSVPWLLLAYGGATVIGNSVVARYATSHTRPVIIIGLVLNALFLTAFAVLADSKVAALLAMIGIGLVGITLNPAMVARVQSIGNPRMLVNSVHSSFITLGVVIGSWAGGWGIDAYGLRAPLWVGAILAVLALVSLTPDMVESRRTIKVGRPVSNP